MLAAVDLVVAEDSFSGVPYPQSVTPWLVHFVVFSILQDKNLQRGRRSRERSCIIR